MIYLDSSVALAQLFGEGRVPPTSFWGDMLTSSRLLEYEIWNRIHARGLGHSLADRARDLLDEVALLAFSPEMLGRALQPFPKPVRTLDAMHLATIEYLRGKDQSVELASYDHRLNTAAQALGIPLAFV